MLVWCSVALMQLLHDCRSEQNTNLQSVLKTHRCVIGLSASLKTGVIYFCCFVSLFEECSRVDLLQLGFYYYFTFTVIVQWPDVYIARNLLKI